MKKKKRVKPKNGIAKFLRSPEGPKSRVIPDKRKSAFEKAFDDHIEEMWR